MFHDYTGVAPAKANIVPTPIPVVSTIIGLLAEAKIALLSQLIATTITKAYKLKREFGKDEPRVSGSKICGTQVQ